MQGTCVNQKRREERPSHKISLSDGDPMPGKAYIILHAQRCCFFVA